MNLPAQTMDDSQKKALILEYFNTFDGGGVRANGESIISLFANDARVWFPKWGLATGTEQIGKMFADLGGNFLNINHHSAQLNYVFSDNTMVAVEGVTSGVHKDGSWRFGEPESGAGRFCNIFEIWNGQIHRLFIYLDPDYAGKDTERYPWLSDAQSLNA